MNPLLLALLVLLPSGLDGSWALVMTLPDGQQMDAPLRIESREGGLHVEVPADEPLVMEEVAFEDGQLTFVMPLGHGRVTCTLHLTDADADRMSGLCAGPMGESVAVATRL